MNLEFLRHTFFKYLQVRNYIRVKQHSMSRPLITELEQVMFNEDLSTNKITLLYSKFVNSSKESSKSKRIAWSTDLKYEFSDSEWSEVCVRVQNLSINTRFKLLQYNWIMRTYITPEKLNKLNSNIPDVCFKCQKYKGMLFHCVWECDVIRYSGILAKSDSINLFNYFKTNASNS